MSRERTEIVGSAFHSAIRAPIGPTRFDSRRQERISLRTLLRYWCDAPRLCTQRVGIRDSAGVRSPQKP